MEKKKTIAGVVSQVKLEEYKNELFDSKNKVKKKNKSEFLCVIYYLLEGEVAIVKHYEMFKKHFLEPLKQYFERIQLKCKSSLPEIFDEIIQNTLQLIESFNNIVVYAKDKNKKYQINKTIEILSKQLPPTMKTYKRYLSNYTVLIESIDFWLLNDKLFQKLLIIGTKFLESEKMNSLSEFYQYIASLDFDLESEIPLNSLNSGSEISELISNIRSSGTVNLPDNNSNNNNNNDNNNNNENNKSTSPRIVTMGENESKLKLELSSSNEEERKDKGEEEEEEVKSSKLEYFRGRKLVHKFLELPMGNMVNFDKFLYKLIAASPHNSPEFAQFVTTRTEFSKIMKSIEQMNESKLNLLSCISQVASLSSRIPNTVYRKIEMQDRILVGLEKFKPRHMIVLNDCFVISKQRKPSNHPEPSIPSSSNPLDDNFIINSNTKPSLSSNYNDTSYSISGAEIKYDLVSITPISRFYTTEQISISNIQSEGVKQYAFVLKNEYSIDINRFCCSSSKERKRWMRAFSAAEHYVSMRSLLRSHISQCNAQVIRESIQYSKLLNAITDIVVATPRIGGKIPRDNKQTFLEITNKAALEITIPTPLPDSNSIDYHSSLKSTTTEKSPRSSAMGGSGGGSGGGSSSATRRASDNTSVKGKRISKLFGRSDNRPLKKSDNSSMYSSGGGGGHRGEKSSHHHNGGGNNNNNNSGAEKVDSHNVLMSSGGGGNEKNESGGMTMAEIEDIYSVEFFQKHLANPSSLSSFISFSERTFCEENVKFWKAAEEFRALKDIDALRDRAKEIQTTFFLPNSVYQLNIDESEMKALEDAFTHSKYSSEMFDRVQQSLFVLMLSDTFPKYLKSQEYKAYTEGAVNNKAKKEDKKEKNLIKKIFREK